MTTLQVTIDCGDPARLVRFWAEALGYVPEAPPDGFADWRGYWRSVGVPEDELADVEGPESIVDPRGAGPRVWFQRVPEAKTVKNRLHFDLGVGGGRSVPLGVRRERVDAETARLAALGATLLGPVPTEPGVEHYAVLMHDPEGNEFCVH